MILALLPSALAQPPVGEWVIDEHVRLVDEDIMLHGNLTILPGGNLSLERSTIRFGPSANVPPRLSISSGGILWMVGTKDSPSGILHRFPDLGGPVDGALTNEKYQVHIDADGVLHGHHCILEGAGTSTETQFAPEAVVGHDFRVAGVFRMTDCVIRDSQATTDFTGANLILSRVDAGITLQGNTNMIRADNVMLRGLWSVEADNAVITRLTTPSQGPERIMVRGTQESSLVFRQWDIQGRFECMNTYGEVRLLVSDSSMTACGAVGLKLHDSSRVHLRNATIGNSQTCIGACYMFVMQGGTELLLENATLLGDGSLFDAQPGAKVHVRGEMRGFSYTSLANSGAPGTHGVSARVLNIPSEVSQLTWRSATGAEVSATPSGGSHTEWLTVATWNDKKFTSDREWCLFLDATEAGCWHLRDNGLVVDAARPAHEAPAGMQLILCGFLVAFVMACLRKQPGRPGD